MGARRAWTMTLAIVAAACSPFDLPPVAAETEHFRYRMRAEGPLCPTALEWLELQYGAVSAWFGASLPSGRKFDYTHVREFTEMEGYCGVQAGGCAGDGMAFAFDAYNAHEVTHLVADLTGDPPALFREGIAEVLGCNPMASALPVRASMELMELVEDGHFRAAQDPHQAYRWAAGFTRFLLDRHGKEAFLDFYAHVPRGATEARIADDFAAHFGEDLTMAMGAWTEAPAQTYRDVCMHLAECAAPPLPDGTGEALAFACGIGLGTAPRALVRTIEAPGPSGLRLRVGGDVPTRVDVLPCDPGGAGPLEHSRRPAGQSELWVTLEAGRHWVRIADTGLGPYTTETIPLHLAATLEPDLLTRDIHEAATQHVASGTAGVLLRGRFAPEPGGDGTHRMALRFTQEAPHRLSAQGFLRPGGDEGSEGERFDGDVVRLCEIAADDTVCEAGSLVSEPHVHEFQSVPWGDAQGFEVEGTPTDDGVMVELRFDPESPHN